MQRNHKKILPRDHSPVRCPPWCCRDGGEFLEDANLTVTERLRETADVYRKILHCQSEIGL